MDSKKSHKRKRGKPMVDGDITSAHVVTYKTVTETKRDGTSVTKRVAVSLDTPSNVSTTDETPTNDFFNNYEPDNVSPAPVERTNPSRVGICICRNPISLLIPSFTDPR
jgi:hypothetical protein